MDVTSFLDQLTYALHSTSFWEQKIICSCSLTPDYGDEKLNDIDLSSQLHDFNKNVEEINKKISIELRKSKHWE